MITENATQSEDMISVPPKHESKLSYRILLVDDDSNLCDLYAEILTRCGYNVDSAADGIAAWNTFNEISYDLLITDNNMPRLTGLGLIKKVRSQNMALPIILASGTIPLEELNQNSRLRIDATLPKPFSTKNLLTVVKKVLSADDNVQHHSPSRMNLG